MGERYITKELFAGLALIAAIGFGVAGMAIDPAGVVDNSALWMIGQFLVFAATLMGVGAIFKKITDKIDNINNGNKGNAKQ